MADIEDGIRRRVCPQRGTTQATLTTHPSTDGQKIDFLKIVSFESLTEAKALANQHLIEKDAARRWSGAAQKSPGPKAEAWSQFGRSFDV